MSNVTAGQRESRLSYAFVGGLLLLTSMLAGCTAPYQFRGERVTPIGPAPEISGTNWDGTPFQLSSLADKVVLVFFGYTFCPDMCPLTLAEMRQLYHDLGNRAGEVAVVFVSVDPQRDTRRRLAEYIPAFDERFFGIHVEPENLADILAGYGVVAEKRYYDPADSSAGYAVDHTTRLYIADKSGRLRLTYPFGALTGDLRSDVLRLLRE